ncbi:hypothetical protein PIB30_085804 [Stylosanthes scabra]|uniref:Uncharacterized protein n=1 Tax=Stylosanthes scabra TaxID=79078 RepID=A0ABU6VUX4_9FABA|nr:hypothetical protein [Stylosanthes scabra]
MAQSSMHKFKKMQQMNQTRCDRAAARSRRAVARPNRELGPRVTRATARSHEGFVRWRDGDRDRTVMACGRMGCHLDIVGNLLLWWLVFELILESPPMLELRVFYGIPIHIQQVPKSSDASSDSPKVLILTAFSGIPNLVCLPGGRPAAALATGSEFLNFQNKDSIVIEESKPEVRLTPGFRQQEMCHRACNQLKIPSIKLGSFSLGIEILWLTNGCENIGVAMVEYQ